MGFDFLGDVLSGFTGELSEERARNQRTAEIQAARENKIFEALANSDDDDVRAAAVTGLLTNNHPAGFLNKFFNRMGEHPAYQTIKGLVGQGKQAFLGSTEEQRRTTEATRSGGITGAVAGAKTAIPDLSPDDQRRIAMGAAGAAIPSKRPQRGTLKLVDGSTTGGYFDEDTKRFYDDSGQERSDVVAFSASGSFGGAATTGRTVAGTSALTPAQFQAQYPNVQLPPGISPTDRISFRLGADNIPTMITRAPAPLGPTNTYTPVYTSGGIQAFGNRDAALHPMAGGESGRAVDPQIAASQYRQDMQSILALHKPPVGLFGGAPSPAQQQVWEHAINAEAVKMGYPDFAALQGLAGQASQATGAAVPQPAQPPPAVPGGPGQAPVRRSQPGRGGPPPATPGAPNPKDPAGILNY